MRRKCWPLFWAGERFGGPKSVRAGGFGQARSPADRRARTENRLDPFLNGLFAEGGRRGLFLQWDGDHLAACDCLGEPSQELPDGWGWIVATGQGLGDPNPLWLIGANDQEGIAQAVQALLTGGCERCYGALVDKAGVCYPLPWVVR